jgi:hypothetical protein
MRRHEEPSTDIGARLRWWRRGWLPSLVPTISALALFPLGAWSQAINPSVIVTNGTVYATAISGNTVYIGGAFSRVGPASGCGAPVNTSTGALPGGFPKVNGYVNAVARDGAGGWFIGGTFTYVGGQPRANLVHIASDMSVAAWNPGTNGPVYALAVNGSVVYVGGAFQTVGVEVRNNIAAVDATSGGPTSWNPRASNTVTALLCARVLSHRIRSLRPDGINDATLPPTFWPTTT